jgi:multidrug efflux pump subunit AcrA (membrane-fusion protein)
MAETTTLRPILELVGTIVALPERTAMVSSQLGGWVERLAVVEGQSVKSGDLLVQLDSAAARTDIERAKAVVAEKTAALQRLRRGYLPNEIETARQDRDKAMAAVDGLRAELTALEVLLKRREFSEVQFETKAKALAAAEAALASAEAHLKLLEEGTPAELIDEAQSLLDVAQADLHRAQVSLDWCSITSPVDGVVVQLLARQGQYFDRASPLAKIVDLSQVFVQLRIPSRQFGKVQPRSQVEIVLESLPDDTFQGSVTRISGEADPLTGNVIVYALVENPDLLLRPGLGCQARISLPEVRDALSVPVRAIADHSGAPVVTVIRDGKAYETKVQIGIQTHELVQVLNGLAPGDIVATSGGYGLPDGCPVEVVAEAVHAKPASR